MTRPPLLIQIDQFCAGIDQRPCDGCDGCGARCTAGVPMLREEFLAIEAELARLPAGECGRVLGQEKRVAVPGSEYFYTACRFRDVERGRCLIYPARPAICRLFGHVEWLPCPIEKVERLVPGAPELMRQYAGAVRKTYEEWAAERDA
jgi:Fe-S-cluster containining protein